MLVSLSTPLLRRAKRRCTSGRYRKEVLGMSPTLPHPNACQAVVDRLACWVSSTARSADKICVDSISFAEPRRHCGGCGGVFCSADAVAIIGFSLRYCPGCRVVLALAVDVIGGPGSRRGSLANSNSRRSSVAQPLGLYSRRGSMIT